LQVNEIFYSIQGESSFMGQPCVFIRLTGCNLRCSYCDSEYAFYEGREMSIPEVLQTLESFPARLALVTGGEPMLQESVYGLFHELLEHRYTVCVETGGQVLLDKVDLRVHKIMDLKCPSSRMMQRNDFGNIQYLTDRDEVKFVIGDRVDFDWACETARRYGLCARVGAVLFSPVYNVLPYDELARWVLECGLQVRMQVQLHKIIWPNILRGV
jgi:7-carboxy-7-deazaguanine synthase